MKSYKHIISFGILYAVTIIAYMWFVRSPYFATFSAWAEANLLLLFSILVIIKFTGIVWPPLSGGLFTLGAVPIIGWERAYLADFAGNLSGSYVAYFLGRRYGYRFLKKIFDEAIIEKIKKVKVKKHREIESVIGLRILGGGALVEIVSYAAGLLGIRARNFIIGVVASHIMIVIPLYYFAASIWSGKDILVKVLLALVAVPFFLKFRERYLE